MSGWYSSPFNPYQPRIDSPSCFTTLHEAPRNSTHIFFGSRHALSVRVPFPPTTFLLSPRLSRDADVYIPEHRRGPGSHCNRTCSQLSAVSLLVSMGLLDVLSNGYSYELFPPHRTK